jgi:hypothetical protein
MRRAIQVDLTEVDEKLHEVEAQHAIDVLALESSDEAIQEDIETLQEGLDAIDVTAYIPKTEKTDFSMDKQTVLDLSKIIFTSFQDVEGEFNLGDILKYALSLVEYEHPTTVSLERINEATFTGGIVVSGDMIPHEPDPGNPFQRLGAPTKLWLEGHFVTVYADNLSANDESGTTRRVLLEGDTVTVSCDDLEDLPDFATVATSGSYNDLTDKPSLEGSIGPPSPHGASEWSDISNKPTWVPDTQASVNLSGLNNDLTATSVEWTDVLNRSSFEEITGPQGPQGPQGEPGLNGASEWSKISNKPTWVATSQGGVNLSEFNNESSLTVNDVEWADVLNKPELLSGSYNDLTDRPSIEDLTGPQGPQGEPGLNGASEWSEISNKPTWVADTQVSVNLSGFNNDLSLTFSDVEWADVLNKPSPSRLVQRLEGKADMGGHSPSERQLVGVQQRLDGD